MSNKSDQKIFEGIVDSWGDELSNEEIHARLIKIGNSSNPEKTFAEEFYHLPLNKEFLKKHGIKK